MPSSPSPVKKIKVEESSDPSPSKKSSPVKIKVEDSDIKVVLGPSGKSYDKVCIQSTIRGFQINVIRGDLFTQPKSEASLAFCVRKGLPQNEEGYCQNFQTKVWPSFRISQS